MAHQAEDQSAIAAPVTPVCGFPISCWTAEEACREIVSAACEGRGGWYVTLNLEMVSRTQKDKDYASLLKRADRFVADGMPIVWATRKKSDKDPAYAAAPERVTGVELVRDLLRHEQRPRVAVIGGENPAAAMETAGVPEISEIWIDDSRIDLSSGGVVDLAGRMRQFGPQVILIALGVPKQDRLALELRRVFPEAVILGIGGSFELIGGQKKRAPGWMQRSGLEWLYRLGKEPKRLWKRYLLLYPTGARALLRDLRRA